MKEDKENTSPFSVLVIEDNLGDFILVEDHLLDKFDSIEIHHKVDFNGARDFLKKEGRPLHLILLDLQLPDASGIELVKNVLDFGLNIPVIILTGYSDLHLAKNSLEMGVEDFLIKDDITADLIYKSIEFALSRSHYVKKIESQNEKLRKIAWTQSHVVRAPLSRILGVINLIELEKGNPEDLSFWLGQLRVSCDEMDEIVQKITEDAQEIQ